MTTPSSSTPESVKVVHASPPVPVPYRRHPLGLPPGSVRGLLTFMVLGIFWTLVVVSRHRDIYIPAYLYYLMFLILGHYFATRGNTAAAGGESHPLYLPRGSIRLLIVLGFVAVVGWDFYNNPDFFEHLKITTDQPRLPMAILAAFFLGIIVARLSNRLLAGPAGLPPWFQDLQAWVSLLAVLGLGAEVIIRLVINPTLDPERQLTLPVWEELLAAVVAFYFGVRS